MLIVIIATACVAVGVGTGLFVSKKRFDNNLSDVDSNITLSVAPDDSLSHEIDRYEQLKRNLVEVRRNVENIEIPTPQPLTNLDDAESSLNKLSAFFEKYSRTTAGTEAFILSILPISQTGEALYSFANVAPDLLQGAFSDSVAALKEGATVPGLDNIHDCLLKFCDGMSHASHAAVGKALMHHDYMGALLKPIKSGLTEMTGLHDATGSLTESIHDMGDTLSTASELSIDPTDLTDWDVSGHIPVMTIAISSFREFNLLMDNKTNAITSLKNIGLDAVGAGGGGLVGAKAGALVGSIFGPIGTLVGGFVGAIGGAVGGRQITNEIKQKPLKDAISAYQAGASRMKTETKSRSRNMLQNINTFTANKRTEFKSEKILKEIPVVESEGTIVGITVIMYQAVVEHLNSMKMKVEKLKESIWYSKGKYNLIADNYSQCIEKLEEQLPPADDIERNPKLALKCLLSLQIPNQRKDPVYKKKFMECSKELQDMNDKNNSSILVWSYMINGLYQRTMNEIAEYANEQMSSFNQFVEQWKCTMSSLEATVNREKGKLGLK
jgi:uncharacterized membrane protein